MRPIYVSCPLLILFWLIAGGNLAAQAELPRKSPGASTSFTVGLVEVTVRYSSPAARDRAIWGAVVPFDRIWRAGANEATTVEFSTDVIIGTQPLAAGKYSLFLIPRESGNWTAVFNKNTGLWGEYGYQESEDAVRTDALPRATTEFSERLTYQIVDTRIDAGEIILHWGQKKIVIPFRTFLEQQMQLAVDRAVSASEESEKWQIYAQAADYLMNSRDYVGEALKYAKKSTSMYQHSWNTWIEAQVYAAQGDYINAVATARKCAGLGAGEDDGFYQDSRELISRSIAEWEQRLKN